MTAASSVTETDPMIKGNMPNDGGSSVGYQSWPVRKCLRDIVSRTGMPSLNKNQTIPARPASVRRAKKRRDFSKMKSLIFRFTRILRDFNRFYGSGYSVPVTAKGTKMVGKLTSIFKLSVGKIRNYGFAGGMKPTSLTSPRPSSDKQKSVTFLTAPWG